MGFGLAGSGRKTLMSDKLAQPPVSPEAADAAESLRKGNVVILPTETVYGVAGVVTHPGAREKLREIQSLHAGTHALDASEPAKPLTLHLARREDAFRYLGSNKEIGDVGMRLLKKVWPGPVGLVFAVSAARRAEVAGALKVEESVLYDARGEITLRCPDHPLTARIIAAAGGDVVLTRAASKTGAPALRPQDIADDVTARVDQVVDAGPTRLTRPSTLLRVRAKGYDIVRAGVYDARIIDRMLKTTILFVCSGNTCRSPMAEAIARKLLAERFGVAQDAIEDKGVQVLSAGTFAFPGAKATPEGAEAVRALGGDLSKHRSSPLTVELVHLADAIFTMSKSHRAAVLSMVPAAASKTFTLDPAGDIEDPIGSDAAVYRKLAGELEKLIARRLEELKDI